LLVPFISQESPLQHEPSLQQAMSQQASVFTGAFLGVVCEFAATDKTVARASATARESSLNLLIRVLLFREFNGGRQFTLGLRCDYGFVGPISKSEKHSNEDEYRCGSGREVVATMGRAVPRLSCFEENRDLSPARLLIGELC
jgi:hypothetical protein